MSMVVREEDSRGGVEAVDRSISVVTTMVAATTTEVVVTGSLAMGMTSVVGRVDPTTVGSILERMTQRNT